MSDILRISLKVKRIHLLCSDSDFLNILIRYLRDAIPNAQLRNIEYDQFSFESLTQKAPQKTGHMTSCQLHKMGNKDEASFLWLVGRALENRWTLVGASEAKSEHDFNSESITSYTFSRQH